MGLTTILLVVLVLLMVATLPAWTHSGGWGYGPSSLIGVIVIVLLALMLTDRL